MLQQLKSLPVLISTIAIALIAIGGMAWSFFGPKGGPPPRALTANEKANDAWFNEIARTTGGDFNKLSPEDKRRLFAMHGPQSPFLLKQAASAAQQKPQ